MLRRVFKFLNIILGRKGLWHVPFVPKVYELVYSYITDNSIVEIKHDGIVIKGFSNDSGIIRCLWLYNNYDDYQLDIYKDICSKSKVVVDVGANIGLYTVLAAKKMEENNINGDVYAFEPETVSHKLLLDNINANGFDNVSVYKLGLSNNNSKRRLYKDRYNFGNNSIDINVITTKSDYEDIDTTTFDEFFKSHINKDIDLYKIDVQGAEQLVLEGSLEALRSNRIKTILLEYLPEAIENLSRKDTLLPMLEGFGYNIFVVNDMKYYATELKYVRSDLKKNKSYQLLCTKNAQILT